MVISKSLEIQNSIHLYTVSHSDNIHIRPFKCHMLSNVGDMLTCSCNIIIVCGLLIVVVYVFVYLQMSH